MCRAIRTRGPRIDEYFHFEDKRDRIRFIRAGNCLYEEFDIIF